MFSGLLVTCSLSIVTTILVYYTYEQSIASNVLESLPKSWTLYVIIMLVTLQLCLSSAVGNSALFQHIEDVLNIPHSKTFSFLWFTNILITFLGFNVRRCIVRSTLIWLAVLLGELIPKFDLVMGVIGGTLTGPLIFILPPLFYTKMLQLEKVHDEETISLMSDYLTDADMLVKSSHYGTVQSTHHIQNDSTFASKLITRVVWLAKSECTLSIIVIIFGFCATLASTYYNIVDFKGFQLWSPCIQNISLSYQLLSL